MTYPHTKLALTPYQIERMVEVIMNVAKPVSSPLTVNDIDYAIDQLRIAFPITNDRDFTDATFNLRATNKALLLKEFNAAVVEESNLVILPFAGQRESVMRRINWLRNAYEEF